MWSRLLPIIAVLTLLAVDLHLRHEIEATQTNLKNVQTVLTDQSNAILAVSRDSQARLQRASEQLAAIVPYVQARNEVAHQFITMRPTGSTECARVQSVDTQFVNALRKSQ